MAIVIEQMTTAYIPIGNDTNDVLVEGDSFERTFTYRDKSTREELDFTGYTFTGKVKDTAGADVADLVVSATGGVVTVSLDVLPAAAVNEYDIQGVAGPITKTLQRGPFHTTAQITT